MPETKPQIYKALIDAQKAMESVVKDTRNDFFKSSYAPLDKVIEVVYPTLHANALAVTQTTGFQDGQFGLITTLWHESGESIPGFYVLDPKEQHNPQMLGAAVTYARRYALMAILGIAPEDDDGNAASGSAPRPVSTTPRLSSPAATPTRQANTQTSDNGGDVPCEYDNCTRFCSAQWVEGSRRKYGLALCAVHGAQARDGEIDLNPKETARTRSSAEEVAMTFPGAEDVDPDEIANLMAHAPA